VGVPLPEPADARVGFGASQVCGTNRAFDFLTLTDANRYAVDLSGWRLAGPIRFTFAGGTVLPATGSLVVAVDLRSRRRALQ
jgi:hypothetical protein